MQSKATAHPALFICGTDTGIGKTITSATLLSNLHDVSNGLRYWKPVQTGAGDSDRRTVQDLTGLPDDCFLPEVHHFTAPLSPHRAAELDNGHVELDELLIKTGEYLAQSPLIIEGAGGLLVPLNRQATWLDYLMATKIPILIIARSGLGTINHSLLTIKMLRKHNLRIRGIVFCGPDNEDNRRTVCDFGDVDCVGYYDWKSNQELPEIFSASVFTSN